MTAKREQFLRIVYKVSDTISVSKGSSRYSRWYVINTQSRKYLSKGFDSKEAAFMAANAIINNLTGQEVE